MYKLAILISVCGAAVGCATSGGGGGGGSGGASPAAASPGWKLKYSSDYDTVNSNMITSKGVPLDDTQLEGVWNDATESTIALVHREGEELRVLIAVGDTRPNIPLTMFEVTDMGNHLPGPDARGRATEALTGWRGGTPTGKDRYLWALAGRNLTPDLARGSWADGNAGCETSHYWGNFDLRLQKDKNSAPVIMVSVMASKKNFGGGVGGQDFDFSRIMYLKKSAKPIPPALLDNLKQADNFCRKTASG